MAADYNTHKEKRAFRASPLEIILLAVVLVGLAFMAKTIFSQPDVSQGEITDLITGLQKRSVELTEKTQAYQRQMEQEKAFTAKRLDEIDKSLKNLETALARSEPSSPGASRPRDDFKRLQANVESLNGRLAALSERLARLEAAAASEGKSVKNGGEIAEGKRAGDDSEQPASPTLKP